MEFKDLIIQKKSRKKCQEGDIFVLNPREGLYCFGKVIQTNVKSKDAFVNGMNLIYIYDYFSGTKDAPKDLENYDLMFAPIVVNYQLWIKGYAETIRNNPVSEKERNIDYGFRIASTTNIVDVNRDKMRHKPKYVGIFGLGSYGIVGKEVQKAIKEKDI